MSPTSADGAQVRMKSTSGGRTISFSHSGSTATYVVEQAVQLSAQLAKTNHIMGFIDASPDGGAQVGNATIAARVAVKGGGEPVVQAIEGAETVRPWHIYLRFDHFRFSGGQRWRVGDVRVLRRQEAEGHREQAQAM